MAERVGFEPTWGFTPHPISSRRRYGHFGTSPRRWYTLIFPDAGGKSAARKRGVSALRRAAGEDYMSEAFYFAPDGLICGLPHARRAVGRTARHRDQDVFLRPAG